MGSDLTSDPRPNEMVVAGGARLLVRVVEAERKEQEYLWVSNEFFRKVTRTLQYASKFCRCIGCNQHRVLES